MKHANPFTWFCHWIIWVVARLYAMRREMWTAAQVAHRDTAANFWRICGAAFAVALVIVALNSVAA